MMWRATLGLQALSLTYVTKSHDTQTVKEPSEEKLALKFSQGERKSKPISITR